MTALHQSFWNENKDIFKVLLQRGADADIKDEGGDSGRSLADDNKEFKTILQ